MRIETRLFLFILMLTTIISSITGWSSQPGSIQNIRGYTQFKHITIKEGLSHNGVWSIARDAVGFMWFGTLHGLNRYDGHDIKTYYHDVTDPHSLSDNALRDLFVDHSGILWVGTWSKGLNQYDHKMKRFIHYRHDPVDPESLSNDSIRSIYEDRSGTLWIGTLGGLNRFDREAKRFTRYGHDPDDPGSLSHDTVFAIYEDSSGTIWIGTDGGLNRFDPGTQGFTRYYHDPADPLSLCHNHVRSIYEDRSGVLWIGTLGGLNQLHRTHPNDGNSIFFTHYQHDPSNPAGLSHNFIQQVHEAVDGTFWIATYGGGLNQLDRTTGTFEHYRYNCTDANSLGNDAVTGFYEDHTGMLWIGTTGDGVNILDRGGKAFQYYRSIPGDSNSLNDNSVRTIYEDRSGILWIGTNSGGLNKLDFRTERFTHYKNDPADPYSIRGNSIFAICEDRQGMLWAGGFGSGLNQLDRDTGKFTRYLHDSAMADSLSENNVTALYEDRAGVLWIGTWSGGLNAFDRKTGRFSRYRHDPADPASLSQDQIPVIYEDRAGTLWIGTMGGLNKFDRQTHQFTAYKHDPDDSHSIKSNAVFSIYEDSANRLWIGMMGGGLDRFDREREQFFHYSINDEASESTVFGILEDDDEGVLWLATIWGMTRFDPRTEVVRNYDYDDGQQGNFASYKSRDGKLFFGSINGITAFYPDQIKDNPHIPPVVITDFFLSNHPVAVGTESVLQQTITTTDHITLSYRDRIFSFKFTALNYQDSKKNRYRYMLEGFENEWNEVDSSRRYVTYTNLDPGEYVFRVIGSNNDGLWNHQGASVTMTVTPPWWETMVVRVLMVLIITGIIVGVFFIQYINARKREQLLERQVGERTRELEQAKENAEAANKAKSTFLATMSHELRTPLNSILGFAQLMTRNADLDQKQKERLSLIQRSGEHLLAVINQVLTFSKIESGYDALNETSCLLNHLLTDLNDMFVIKAKEKGLDLVFEQKAHVPSRIYTDEVKLRQVLINLLNNAVKFTQKGSVTLTVSNTTPVTNEDDLLIILQFTVSDTGAGIAADEIGTLFDVFTQTKTGSQKQEGTGLGLPISRKFVQLMGGDIRVQTTVGEGTSFTFEIRVKIDATGEVQQAEMVRKATGLKPGKIRYRILIVDDLPDNRALLMDILSPYHFELREACNGREAIEIWKEWRPDLIWMDLRMPVMDGWEATRYIKSTLQGKATVIIALSAHAFEETREEILRCGCNDFVRKPYREDEIFEKIGHYLGTVCVYESGENYDSHRKQKFIDDSLIIPSGKKLKELYNLARYGDMDKIAEWLTGLTAGDVIYEPFAAKLMPLVEKFSEQDILAFVEACLARDYERGPDEDE